MDAPPTLLALKQTYITAQTTLLSRGLAPSRAWHATNANADPPVPDRALADALFGVDNHIQRHSRRVYPPQADGNVAEQVNALYAAHGDRLAGDASAVDDEGGIGREVDLTDTQSIEALPETWPKARDTRSHPAEAKRYADSVTLLTTLSTRRANLQARVARLRQIQSTIKPLDRAGAAIQENLVTRDGALEKELERMRMLLARVSSRVGALPEGGKGNGEEEEEIGEVGLRRKRNVDEFLADANVFPS